MECKPQIGKIYDTIAFCTRYFNPDEMQERVLCLYEDTFFANECYRRIAEKVPTLSPLLWPCFIYRKEMATALTNFFSEQSDCETETFESFTKKIIENSSRLYAYVVHSVFQKGDEKSRKATPNMEIAETLSPSTAPEEYMKALLEVNLPQDLKLQVSLLFGNFDYAVSLLIGQLQEIYTHVEALHTEFADKLEAKYKQIESEQNISTFKEVFTFDISNKDNINFYSVSLLNQFVVHYKGSNEKTCVLYGYKHEDTLRLSIDSENIDIEDVLIACGNDIRIAIIRTLMEVEKVTISSAARRLKLPVTTLLRHMDVLCSHNIVYRTKQDGLQVLYKLNYDILFRA